MCNPSLLSLKVIEIDLCHVVHITADGRISRLGRSLDVLERAASVSNRFKVQADVQLGVKLAARRRSGRLHNLFGCESASEHLVNLAHRDAGIRTDGEQSGFGRRWRFATGDAEK